MLISVHCSVSKNVTEIQLFGSNNEVVVQLENTMFQEEAAYLSNHLSLLLNKKIEIKSENSSSDPMALVLRYQETLDESQFVVKAADNKLIVEAKTTKAMQQGVIFFLMHILEYIPYSHRRSLMKYESKTIPKSYHYTSKTPAFGYRVPYFIENYNVDFRKVHQTQMLDDTWGLWGHNIPKKIIVTPQMYAEINGEKNEEQLCFSSTELHKALIKMVQKNQIDNPAANKFMIMPLDDVNACTCTACSKRGNTPRNASPAVFLLINQLAEQFPDVTFFGSAYHSTRTTPDFPLKSNVGVMFTTMDFPKGIQLQNSKFGLQIEKQMEQWRKKTSTLYLWDYAIHFDNYLSTYPTVLSTAMNLNWYEQLGITGVFMQGTEETYSAFSDLKAFLFAELLKNPKSDVRHLTGIFFGNFYPKSKDMLQPYYIRCEERALNSAFPLDIYGGWQQHFKKYLDAADLFSVLNKLEGEYALCSEEEKQNLNPILAALYFQKLEIQRTQGIREFGLLEKHTSDKPWRLKPAVKEDFRQWQKYRKLAKLELLNESGMETTTYDNQWQQLLLDKNLTNILLGIPPQFQNQPDEDYADAAMLTDGAVGFSDYFNNWVISTQNAMHIKIPLKEKATGKYTLEMNFLQDKRHRIYLPKRISLNLNGISHEISIPADADHKPQKVYRFKHDVVLEDIDTLDIAINKTAEFTKFATACDEIRLIPKP